MLKICKAINKWFDKHLLGFVWFIIILFLLYAVIGGVIVGLDLI